MRWRALRQLVVELCVWVPLTVFCLWFTWQNIEFMLHTRPCEREGTCVVDSHR